MNIKQRIIENYKKNKVSTIVLLLVWAITVVSTLFLYNDTLGKQSFGNEVSNNVIELDKNTKIVEIVAIEQDFESIAVKFATYARNNKGNITIVVKGNDSGEIYVTKTSNVSLIQDNAFLTVKLDEIVKIDKDDSVTISIESNSENGKAIGVYSSIEKYFDNSAFTINGIEDAGDLTVRFLANDEELNLYSKYMVYSSIIAITFIIVLLLFISPKIEIIFAICVLLIGSVFCFLMTPMSVPDEQAHYEYAFQLSSYLVQKEDHGLINDEYQDYGSYVGHKNVSSAYKKIVSRWNNPLRLDDTFSRIEFDIDDIYIGGYVVPATGITIARLLSLNRIKTFFLGRMFNLAFYAICIYIAIKKTPIHKLMFGLLSIMPIFAQQAASYSYDGFVNGLSLITLAYLLKFIFVEEKISWKEILIITVILSILAPEKIVYSLFSFLFWFVPIERYGNRGKKILITLLLNACAFYQLYKTIAPVIVRALANIKELGGIYIDTRYNMLASEINSEFDTYLEKITVGYIVRHPWQIVEIMLRTVRYNLKNWFYGSLGRQLSGANLILPMYFVHALSIIIIVASFRKEQYVEPIYLKTVFIVVCLIIGLFMLGGFLLSWTKTSQDVIAAYGGPIIEGIQGRYFCPLLPFVFAAFNNKKLTIPEKLDKYFIYALLLVNFEVIIYVLSYTFVN